MAKFIGINGDIKLPIVICEFIKGVNWASCIKILAGLQPIWQDNEAESLQNTIISLKVIVWIHSFEKGKLW